MSDPRQLWPDLYLPDAVVTPKAAREHLAGLGQRQLKAAWRSVNDAIVRTFSEGRTIINAEIPPGAEEEAATTLTEEGWSVDSTDEGWIFFEIPAGW